jgi:GT2 family glycosyltransferase
MISYIIPTRNRPDDLARTLGAIAGLAEHEPGGVEPAEVIVVDNASRFTPVLPRVLENGVRVHPVLLDKNLGAAARNRGVQHAHRASRWVVMLDDDSHPVDGSFVHTLHEAADDTAVVTADIRLPMQNRREDGGLPEVFIGCGAAIRREVFDRLGGYDSEFEYYVEEYDLAARIIAAGYRIVFEPRFRVDHFKAAAGRDMNRIVSRLLRNGCWVMQRYAPEPERRTQLRAVRQRCRLIAELENATEGYRRGLEEVRRTLHTQRRRPHDRICFDRFTGLWHARDALRRAHAGEPFDSAAVVARGKNAWVVDRALAEIGVSVVPESQAQVRVIGTMSPGPMLDARDRFAAKGRTIAPWSRAQQAARG